MADEKGSSNDLPLSANLQDITVKHFVLDLSCHMAQQVFEGSIMLWCLPTQTETAVENQKNNVEDTVTVCAAEKVDRNEQLPSESSSVHSRIPCQTERVQSDEGNNDSRCVGVLGQDHCMNTETEASHASVSCIHSSSSSVRDSCEMAVKMADKPPQSDEVKESLETFTESASLGRNSACGCVPDQRHASDCNYTDHNVVDVDTHRQDLQEKSIDKKCITDKRDKSIIHENSSSHDPDFVTLSRVCCHGYLTDERNSVDTDVPDIPSHLMSFSACDSSKDDVVQQETIVQSSVPQNTSLFSLNNKYSPQTIETSGCFKSDVKYDTAMTNAVPQKPERVDHSYASQTTFFVQDKCSSILNEKDTVHSESFRMILDSHKLDVQKVEGVYLQGDEKSQFEEHPDTFVQLIGKKYESLLSEQRRCQMQFIVKEHCLHVFVEGVSSPQQFPHAVQIWYQTQPSGPSLKWTRDQDNHPCVFTLGHFLSNRSLFPSQDFPTALLTWQASITVDPGLTVLLTGDEDPQVTVTDNGRKKFTYFTQFLMPTSTFAIAVGSWEMEILQYGSLLDEVVYGNVDKPPIRLFFPELLKEKSLSVLSDYLLRCMLEVQRMLGRYPFHRLDVLLVPACFDSLGMASPSLLFLSQSLLCGDGSMCVRVAHELCHTWFGLVIGPRDWTEEWMTEGFCTYLEDILHALVTQLGEATDDYLGLRTELHLRVLKAEMENTDENLQSLRPNKGQGEPQCSGEETRFLKNGMNVEKKFMQVHYLKGYFLLHALGMEVGRTQFLSFLKEYVQRYLYQLVTSQEFLQMFFSTFTDLKYISVDSINADWLDCPGMPKRLSDRPGKDKGIIDKENALSAQVQQEVTSLVRICRRSKRKRQHGGRPCRNQQLPELNQMLTPQILVLLDRLLDEKVVPGQVLDLLRSSYNLHLHNPEVCHRWCELVVKHRHKKWYSDVEQFLIHHQAMGVYLYGEASISQCPDIIHVARSCFQQLEDDMPESVRDTVSAMLFGTSA